MTEAEGRLAVELSAGVTYGGKAYVASGLLYGKDVHGHRLWSMLLLDRNGNSTLQAPLSAVTVVRWNCPEELIEQRLKETKS